MIALPDDDLADLLGAVPEATTFISNALVSSETAAVAVHCHAGESRSSAIVAAYLMRFEHSDVDDALAAVKALGGAPGFRIHPFDGVVIAPAFFFLLGAGFGAELAGVLAVFQIILGLFFHANVRVRWRLLDRVVANPEFHHWHHSSEADAVGHNYGAALPWWDMVFGTFFMPERTAGRRPARYGVSEPLPSSLIGQLMYPCRGARRHLWPWRHPILLVRTLATATRNLLADIRRAAGRPTHSIRREPTPGVRTTNASLVGPEAVPKRAKRPLPARAPKWPTTADDRLVSR